jgi:hypothetical protein
MCVDSWGSQKQGEHGVVLTQTMHLTGRVARPYANVVGANSSCDRMCYMTFALARTANGINGATT